MKIISKDREFSYSFPPKEPTWASRVDRWYQLDAYAFGLCEAYWSWKESQLLEAPSMIVLGSPLASNETDQQFVQSGAKSPAKFSHTLPSIRSSPLCQVMGWEGVVLCLQRGAETFEVAAQEAETFVNQSRPRIWALGVIKQSENQYAIRFREYRVES